MDNNVSRTFEGVIAAMASKKKGARYTLEEKRALLAECDKPGMNMAAVARKYGVATSRLFTWRRELNPTEMSAVANEQMQLVVAKNRELERLLGKQMLENEILKEALHIAAEKKWLLPKSSSNEEGSQ